MLLSKSIIEKIEGDKKSNLSSGIHVLPEKVLQFGTGVLLRALPDFIIDQANNKGFFNGRIVVVKSTTNGSADGFAKQDGLYTVCIRGINNGEIIKENHVVKSISRVLSASSEWNKVLECAANPEMQVIISNTTEAGIVLVKDNIHADPPSSFPGKLLAFLYHRYKYFKGETSKGLVIVPTELIPENGEKLISIILELAHLSNLEIGFIDWLENANHFCNSLVDRIVPGKLNVTEHKKMEDALGYTDELMITSEVYALWAIQCNSDQVKKILSFAFEGSGIVITPDIAKYRELKLRLLNSPHTFTCGLAILASFQTVRQVMEDELMEGYIKHLMFDEIIPTITGDLIKQEEAIDFADKVLDRYRNIFIEHKWASISMQSSLKMKMRNIKLIENYIGSFGHAPLYMAIGMAAHIVFMRTESSNGKFNGVVDHTGYEVTDDNASLYATAWENSNVVEKILANESLWDSDLTKLNGFCDAVQYWVNIISAKGVSVALKEAVNHKIVAANEE